MQGARDGDSGIYECIPDNAPAGRIKVHILKDGAGQFNSARRKTNGNYETFGVTRVFPSS